MYFEQSEQILENEITILFVVFLCWQEFERKTRKINRKEQYTIKSRNMYSLICNTNN